MSIKCVLHAMIFLIYNAFIRIQPHYKSRSICTIETEGMACHIGPPGKDQVITSQKIRGEHQVQVAHEIYWGFFQNSKSG
jgi:hypothetical protein